MKNVKSSYNVLGGFTRGASRIFFILRTRKIYGYNSVIERIFRYLFTKKRRLITVRRNKAMHTDTFMRG
ncbi:MAG: hypothetical protein ABSA71_17795 [Desulfomonilia bacterium]|jgi:hypothetical protein